MNKQNKQTETVKSVLSEVVKLTQSATMNVVGSWFAFAWFALLYALPIMLSYNAFAANNISFGQSYGLVFFIQLIMALVNKSPIKDYKEKQQIARNEARYKAGLKPHQVPPQRKS